MPATIAHFVTLIETYHALKKGNEKIFQAKPVKENELKESGAKLGLSTTDKGISQYAFLGSVFPDVPYYNDKTEAAADLFHYNRASTYAIKLIDYAKGKKGSAAGNRLMALALGFISHIACDVVCHPYVNTIAGAYWKQPLSFIDRVTLPMLNEMPFISVFFRKGKVQMHMMTEAHQDSWLAKQYFGLEDLSSTGATRSWSDFIDEIGLGYFTSITDETVELFGDVRSCFQEVYGEKLEEEPLEDAGDTIFEALDGSYDRALFPLPDSPSENLVNYKHKSVPFANYYFYLTKAFNLSKALCRKAIDYYNGGDPEKESLKKYLKDWNLDTGYCINLYTKKNKGKIESIHIRYEHSWCHNYGLYDLPEPSLS